MHWTKQWMFLVLVWKLCPLLLLVRCTRHYILFYRKTFSFSNTGVEHEESRHRNFSFLWCVWTSKKKEHKSELFVMQIHSGGNKASCAETTKVNLNIRWFFFILRFLFGCLKIFTNKSSQKKVKKMWNETQNNTFN